MKNIRIGIDGNEANITNRVGSNVYAWELLNAMYDFLKVNPLFSVTVYLSSKPIVGWPPEQSWWKYRVVTPAKLWTQWRLPLDLYLNREIDLFFSPGHYGPRWSPVPTVVTVMDLAYEYFPDFFRKKDYLQLHSWTQHSVRMAKHIFAISESTKRDVITHYDRRGSDVTVVYPAVKRVKKMTQAEVTTHLQSLKIGGKYIAYVGTLQPRKNIERLVGAFEQLVEKGWVGKLVLAGKVGWLGEAITARIATSPHRDKIIETGFIAEDQKTALIQGAECTVLVGLYEGFGIPPLESIQLGTIPVVSDNSSLPEVVGTGGVFVDSMNEDDIARGLRGVLQLSTEQKAKHLGQMTAHAAGFSWEESAKRACMTLHSLVAGTHVL